MHGILAALSIQSKTPKLHDKESTIKIKSLN